MTSTSHSLFISDIHLSQACHSTTQLFQKFLDDIASCADNLYILGDFFDVWVGDDARQPWQKNIFKNLQTLAKNGVKIYFMKGNRDFLISHKLCKSHGIISLPDVYVAELYGMKILLLHGDTLCIDDSKYQRYRSIVRNKFVQKLFLALPIKWRRGIARKLRKTSSQHQHYIYQMDRKIIDANKNAVRDIWRQYNPDVLIHGHTHRFAMHFDNAVKRFVLGDWHNNYGSYIKVTASQETSVHPIACDKTVA